MVKTSDGSGISILEGLGEEIGLREGRGILDKIEKVSPVRSANRREECV